MRGTTSDLHHLVDRHKIPLSIGGIFFMGWETDLQDASYRGVAFECVSTTDAHSKSLAVHQSPYSNVATVEDLGNDPAQVTLQAVYVGSDYKQWLDALESALSAHGAAELIHPIYGILNAAVQSYSVNHSYEQVDACTIDIDFIVADSNPKPLFIPVVTDEIIAPVAVAAPASSALQKYMDKLKQLDQNQYFEQAQKIRNGINKARDELQLVRQTIQDVFEPAAFVQELVDDFTRLMTFDPTQISALAQWRDALNRIARLKNIFSDDSNNQSYVSRPFEQYWRATAGAALVGTAKKLTDTTRQQMAQNVSLTQPSLTPLDLASIRSDVRTQLQQAIKKDRGIPNDDVQRFELPVVEQVAVYKTAADQVHQITQQLIETQPPITVRRVDVPCTLHWLAHAWYRDFDRAEEIKRLNPTLHNPAVIAVGTELTVYAR